MLVYLQKLGVPLEGKVRVQLNLKVENAPNSGPASKFPSIIYPIMWLEEVSIAYISISFKFK